MNHIKLFEQFTNPKLEDNLELVNKILVTLQTWCENYEAKNYEKGNFRGMIETPRYSQLARKRINTNKVWALYSTQDSTLFYEIENLTDDEILLLNKLNNISATTPESLWNQYKKIRTEYLIENYPAIDPY
jgi:hypothetical protein